MNTIEKAINLINRLPIEPPKQIIWIVYNDDLIDSAKALIQEIRGPEYMQYVTVVSKSNSYRLNGAIYFDPSLYDLIGNGNG